MRKDQPEFHGPGTGDELRDFDLPHDLPSTETEKALAQVYKKRLPFYGSPEVENVRFANGFAELAAVALARAHFYGELLAEAYEREGLGALIGAEYGGVAVGGESKHLETFEKSEMVRSLVALEQGERDRAATLIEKGVRLGMEASHVDAMRTYGRTVAEVSKAFAEETGLDWSSPAIRRAAQRALLTARARLGFDFAPANAAGPALTQAELREARTDG